MGESSVYPIIGLPCFIRMGQAPHSFSSMSLRIRAAQVLHALPLSHALGAAWLISLLEEDIDMIPT